MFQRVGTRETMIAYMMHHLILESISIAWWCKLLISTRPAYHYNISVIDKVAIYLGIKNSNYLIM